jgi:hypothetical protein
VGGESVLKQKDEEKAESEKKDVWDDEDDWTHGGK